MGVLLAALWTAIVAVATALWGHLIFRIILGVIGVILLVVFLNWAGLWHWPPGSAQPPATSGASGSSGTTQPTGPNPPSGGPGAAAATPTPQIAGCPSYEVVKNLVTGTLLSTEDKCHKIDPDRVTPDTLLIMGTHSKIGILGSKDIRNFVIGVGVNYQFTTTDNGREPYCELWNKVAPNSRPPRAPDEYGWAPCEGMPTPTARPEPMKTATAQAEAQGKTVDAAIAATATAYASATAAANTRATETIREHERQQTAVAETLSKTATAIREEVNKMATAQSAQAAASATSMAAQATAQAAIQTVTTVNVTQTAVAQQTAVALQSTVTSLQIAQTATAQAEQIVRINIFATATALAFTPTPTRTPTYTPTPSPSSTGATQTAVVVTATPTASQPGGADGNADVEEPDAHPGRHGHSDVNGDSDWDDKHDRDLQRHDRDAAHCVGECWDNQYQHSVEHGRSRSDGGAGQRESNPVSLHHQKR